MPISRPADSAPGPGGLTPWVYLLDDTTAWAVSKTTPALPSALIDPKTWPYLAGNSTGGMVALALGRLVLGSKTCSTTVKRKVGQPGAIDVVKTKIEDTMVDDDSLENRQVAGGLLERAISCLPPTVTPTEDSGQQADQHRSRTRSSNICASLVFQKRDARSSDRVIHYDPCKGYDLDFCPWSGLAEPQGVLQMEAFRNLLHGGSTHAGVSFHMPAHNAVITERFLVTTLGEQSKTSARKLDGCRLGNSPAACGQQAVAVGAQVPPGVGLLVIDSGIDRMANCQEGTWRAAIVGSVGDVLTGQAEQLRGQCRKSWHVARDRHTNERQAVDGHVSCPGVAVSHLLGCLYFALATKFWPRTVSTLLVSQPCLMQRLSHSMEMDSIRLFLQMKTPSKLVSNSPGDLSNLLRDPG